MPAPHDDFEVAPIRCGCLIASFLASAIFGRRCGIGRRRIVAAINELLNARPEQYPKGLNWRGSILSDKIALLFKKLEQLYPLSWIAESDSN